MSFGDLMSSGKGPGVIGMMMALVVVGGFGALYVFVFDAEMQGKGVTIESVIRDNNKEIESYKEQIDNANRSLAGASANTELNKRAADLKMESMTLTATIADLQKDISETRAACQATEAAWATYKNDYRVNVRSKAAGEKLPEIKLLSGSVYKNVEIREVTAIGVQIRHEDGQKRIAFEELPEEWQDRFQFDAEQKDKALATESAQQRMHEEAVEKATAELDSEDAADVAKLAATNSGSTKDIIQNKEKLLSQLQTELGAAQSIYSKAEADEVDARRFNRVGSGRNMGAMKAKVDQKRRHIEALKKEIKVLKYGSN